LLIDRCINLPCNSEDFRNGLFKTYHLVLNMMS
jgi:hypothetical protein